MTDHQPDRSRRDELFAAPQAVVDFAFNAAVADVFPDMLRRSIPGYETIISQLGVLARQYAQPNSRIYDLGCSLGAATLAMVQQVQQPDVCFIGVDNSPVMVQRCQQRLERHLPGRQVQITHADIAQIKLENASLVVLNFTLQFLPPEQRLNTLQRIYQGLLPGGALVLSEKIDFADPQQQTLMNDLYLAFKRANGYSELEISQKRTALENVLIPDTLETHQHRLQQAGFKTSTVWFQSLRFVSLLALK